MTEKPDWVETQQYDQNISELLVGYTNRILMLRAEREVINSQLSDTYWEMRKLGIDTKALRLALAERYRRHTGPLGTLPPQLPGVAGQYQEILNAIDIDAAERWQLEDARLRKNYKRPPRQKRGDVSARKNVNRR